MVVSMVFWLNCIPRKGGVSNCISPQIIFNGKHLDIKDVKYCFEDFLQRPVDNPNTNGKAERTFNTIFCRPALNKQGGM